MIVPYVQWLSPFRLIGRFEVSLQFWLIIQAIVSFTAKLDIAASSLFFAKIVTSYTCHESMTREAQEAWEFVIKKGMVFWVPFLDQLVVICLLGWAIILLQVIVAFIMSHPWKGTSQTDYRFGGERDGYATLWTKCSETFRCLHGHSPKEWHVDVLRIIADATRSQSLVELSCAWQMERVSKELDRLDHDCPCEDVLACSNELGVPRTEEPENQKKEPKMRQTPAKKEHRCFDIVFKVTQRISFCLWFIKICEKAVIMEAEVTMYAFVKATSADFDVQVLLALIISYLSLVNALCVACVQLWRLLATHKQAVDCISSRRDQEEQHTAEFETCLERCKTCLFRLPRAGTLPSHEGVLSMARRAKVAIILRIGGGIFVLFVVLLHTLVKLVMAHVCEYGLWNVPMRSSDFEDRGCVDLSSFAEGYLNILKAS